MRSLAVSLLLIVILFFQVLSKEAKVDSLKYLLTQPGLSISEKASIFHALADYYDAVEDYKSAVNYYSLALSEYRDTGDADKIAHTLNTLGKNHSFAGDDAKSLACFREVLTMENELSERTAIGDALHNIGIVFQYDSKPDSAFFYYKMALEERESIGNISKIASSLRALGEILRGMDRRNEALDYCLRALSMKDEIDDKAILANIYNETGYLYELSGKLDTALLYYENLTILCREIGLKRGESIGLANSAVIYERLGQYDKTLKLHFQALAIDQDINYKYGIMKDYFLIAITYNNLKDYETALSYLTKSDSLCTAKTSADYMEIQELYYQIYKEKSAFEKALKSHENFTYIKDSIASADVKTKIARLHTEYETEKKEHEIKLLNAENELKDQKLKLTTILIITLLLLGILSIGVFFLLIRQRDLKIKHMHAELRNFLLEVEELKLAIADKNEWVNNKVNDLLKKYDITDREADILHLISHGYNNSEIAEKLFISINTVKYHIKNLYLKLDAKNRIEIINRFAPESLIVS